MALLDWLIMLVFVVLMVLGIRISKRYMKSVADFLSAGRSAGRYLIGASSGVANLGVITVIAYFEFHYQSGFTMKWWDFTYHFFLVLMAISGWVFYRFRETRALTLAQFFEMRYSRNFRVFAGIVAFIAGIINFGIFPGIAARFFINFTGLPKYFSLLGFDVSVYALIMILLLVVACYFVIVGGQIAVLITDFFQWVLISIVFIVICIFFISMFEYSQIFEALQSAPESSSLINPFDTGEVKHFNFWYFLVMIIGLYYGPMAWQGSQGVNSSAKDAHEAKMGQVLSYWRILPQSVFFLLIPIIAYTVYNHADFIQTASVLNNTLDGLGDKMQISQMRVPVMLTHFLPIGLMGAFGAIMLAAFISTHDTYLHSWASIFIQDVVLPLKKKPLTSSEHLKLLKISIIAVAIFIFIFSMVFNQNQYILLFFAVTSAIFTGGAGAVIIFGLYWKKGTTTAAWSAMLTGGSIAIVGIVLNEVYDEFFIDGQMFLGISMAFSCLAYVIVSLLGKKEFNLDKMLHRGKYALKGEHTIIDEQPSKGLRVLGIGKEFKLADKLVYFGSYAWIFSWLVVFLIGTVVYFSYGISDEAWMEFWYIYTLIFIVMSIVIIIWFVFGGVKDVRNMFKILTSKERNELDDGIVRN